MKRYLKIFSGLVLFVILALNVSSISRWTETRGVYDDFCYLRQAHLFQKFGLGGLDTNIAQDDEQYLSGKMKETNLLDWKDPMIPPCHVQMSKTHTEKWRGEIRAHNPRQILIDRPAIRMLERRRLGNDDGGRSTLVGILDKIDPPIGMEQIDASHPGAFSSIF